MNQIELKQRDNEDRVLNEKLETELDILHNIISVN